MTAQVKHLKLSKVGARMSDMKEDLSEGQAVDEPKVEEKKEPQVPAPQRLEVRDSRSGQWYRVSI